MGVEFEAEEVFDSMRKQRFEPSRYFMDFHIAGFAYYDGLDVIDELKLGTPVTLVSEPDNPHDADAVAIYYKHKKLGYIPAGKNQLFTTFLYFSHTDIFEARIQMAKMDNHPERQFRVVVRVKDKRKSLQE